ncbi:hypothetical protein H6F90_11865 [Trichocoleus sp. FACHB-591]|uniref:hypothetical protein n=1 Tax=Trichocoleus sp. FACHB-591 TaxID=2692872 RepID=UPI001684431C|nr:hypothetical protein [Trichocoleus sp. FACHB-591]MBD2095845.1 hypothetical protein [Trichocoleus sp. FACHB-591]
MTELATPTKHQLEIPYQQAGALAQPKAAAIAVVYPDDCACSPQSAPVQQRSPLPMLIMSSCLVMAGVLLAQGIEGFRDAQLANANAQLSQQNTQLETQMNSIKAIAGCK